MRLVEVRDLMAGQGWWDLVQHRYGAPPGTPMHWSRLIDAPLAALIAALSFVFGADRAEGLAVVAWPFGLFALYAAAIAWGAWRLFGPTAAGFAVFAAGQMIIFSDLFAAGRIDHHNVQVALMAAAVIGFGLSERGGRAALASGALCGLSLAIGLETLPLIAVIAAASAARWIADGSAGTPSFRAFGAGIAGAAAGAFLIQTAPSLWFAPACDALSAPWLLLTTGGGLAAFGLTAATSTLPFPPARFATAGLVAVILAGAFAIVFPQCLEGPYEAVPQPARDLWLAGIPEAFSIHRLFRSDPATALQAFMPMLIAAAALTHACRRRRITPQPPSRLLGLLAVLLWLGVALALFQTRTLYVSSAVLPLAVGWFLADALSRRGERSAIANGAALCAAILMLGISWAAIGQGVRPSTTIVSVEPERQEAASRPCEDPESLAPLAGLPSGMVLAEPTLGPYILLHTPHAIVTAGYHRSPQGINAGIKAFSGAEADMRDIARQFGVDYLALCPRSSSSADFFAGQLANGANAAWLAPLEANGPLKLWRVEP